MDIKILSLKGLRYSLKSGFNTASYNIIINTSYKENTTVLMNQLFSATKNIILTFIFLNYYIKFYANK